MPFNQICSDAQAIIDTYNDVAGDQTINIYQTPDTKELKKELHKDQSAGNIPRSQASLKDFQIRKTSGPCFEGTRVALLQEMTDWPTSQDESKMYILSGLAGIGKSTIAYTVAARANEHRLLGASFFFSRDDADRNNAKKFFTTIAYQLCLYNEGFSQAIGEALVTERGSTATTRNPQEQLEALILEPLRSITAPSDRPTLVVVDALDECDDEDSDSVLMGLSRMVQDLPSFKVILTTRPQPLLSIISDTAGGHKIFHLQDIEDKVVNDDIRLYLEHSLSWEQVKARLPGLRKHWYASDAEIESLVRAAGKLFIIASTAVLFILDKVARNPKRQMERLLHTFSQDRGPSKHLNDFYSIIVRNAVPEGCDDYIVERFKSVVGAVVVIQTPLPITALAFLLGIEEDEIYGALDNLQSVILIGDDLVPRIYHKSFVDYLTGPDRCKDVNVQIDPTDCHMSIGLRCFRTMNKHLKYNILGLDGPARYLDNEEGLANQGISDGQLQEKVPSGLRYACIYWVNHLESTNIEDAGLMKELKEFTDHHMLHWFEALSLVRELGSAYQSFRVALRLAKPISPDLFRLLSDGLRFISKFYQVIGQSALHTYHSALPFAPTESLLYHKYSTQATVGICQVRGGPEEWDALIATPSHNDWPDQAFDVKFSLDSSMFASWNNQASMKIWDASTGAPVSTLSLKSNHVAIANDFSTIALAENDVITVHNIKTSAPVATFTTSARIWGLALSSESNRVAAWLEDGTICLWDSGKGKLIACFGGFDYPQAITFSPTGTRLAYMPHHGGIMQLRDGITGTLIANLDDQSEMRYKLVFSHDGSRFAVLMQWEGLSLWESESGRLVGVAKGAAGGERNLVISANGSLLAIGGRNQVQFWSGDNGNPLPLIGKLDLESWLHNRTVVLSPDGTLATVVNGSNIIVYDVRSSSVICTLPSQSQTLAFSPDCTRLISINSGDIYLWDVRSIIAPGSRSNEKTKRIRDLAFSQDCAHLACLFEDYSIELWGMGLPERRIPIHHCQDPGERVVTFGFNPDGSKFAIALRNGIIGLWSSEGGTPIGSFRCSTVVREIALSNCTIAVLGPGGDITLWDLRILQPIGTAKQPNSQRLSFSSDGSLLASYNVDENYTIRDNVTVLDVMKGTTIGIFDVHGFVYDSMDFSPDGSQLVVQFENGDFRSFDLVTSEVTCGPSFNHLVQLRHFQGIPVWLPLGSFHRRHHLVGLFPQYKDPVPVLWIPSDLRIRVWAQGSSMIALVCADGRIIFVQPST